MQGNPENNAPDDLAPPNKNNKNKNNHTLILIVSSLTAGSKLCGVR
jgi:hypothetical protein